ncbi:hypothetical protein [Luteibacter yeojuensis]
MRPTIRYMALIAGLAVSMASGSASGPGRPSFEDVATAHRGYPWSTDPCGLHRPMAGLCRMLRPVRG